MSEPRAHERIAGELTEAGLDARPIDGWVYVALDDGRLMCISAEYGQSLDVSFYASPPAWFTDPEPP